MTTADDARENMRKTRRRRVVPIILAAGASRRMGFPKALLALGEKSFVRHIIALYASVDCGKAVVVLGAHRKQVEEDIAGLDVSIVVNENYNAGQITSVIAGIDKGVTPGADGILLHPVDHPLVSVDVVRKLLAAFDGTRGSIVLPKFEGRRGHPVIFSSALFEELREAPLSVGARSVVWSHASEVVEVKTNDEGIVQNVDTPELYDRFCGRRG